jgi:hypothetical protein
MDKDSENNLGRLCPIFRRRSDEANFGVSSFLNCIEGDMNLSLTSDDKEKADVTKFKTSSAQTMEKYCSENI